MPLKALLDGQPIVAPLLGDREWAELYFQRPRLVLPCCPGVAVQLRGGAGTARIQHFSHTPLPTCQFRGETTAHLRAKVVIARAATAVGWAVDIEHAAADWRADVLATDAGRRVAFEVQWSRQTLRETEARQARYRAAGVRGCWFVRYPPTAPPSGSHGGRLLALTRQDLPVFPLVAGRGRAALGVQIGARACPLDEAVMALLRGRIAFRPQRTVAGAQALDLLFYEKPCPTCRSRVGLYALAPSGGAALSSACGQRVLLWSEAVYHPDIMRAARQAYATAVPPDAHAPLAHVAPGGGFRCPHCGAPVAPLRADGLGPMAVRWPIGVTLTQPLCDPFPHWCYPVAAAGAFCAADTSWLT